MFLLKVVKRVLFALLYLIGINFILVKMGFTIPINIFSLLVVGVLRFPGVVLLIFFSRW